MIPVWTNLPFRLSASCRKKRIRWLSSFLHFDNYLLQGPVPNIVVNTDRLVIALGLAVIAQKLDIDYLHASV